jgi:pilus assembly protein CpaE
MEKASNNMRILIASDNERVTADIRTSLSRHGFECPAGHTVTLEDVAHRASRLVPDLLLLALSGNSQVGLEAVREIRGNMPGAYLLAVGPAVDAQLILKTLQEGADEFLDEEQLEAELAGSLVRFKSKGALRQIPEQTGRVISVLAPSGGSGASTVAVNVSIALAEKHRGCALIDLKLAAGDLASMLNLKPAYTLADLCDHLERLDQSMFDQFFVRHKAGVSLLAAPHEFSDISRVTSKGIRRTFSLARVRFPYIVADLQNVIDSEQVEALWQSDVILFVLRLDYTAVRNARRALDNLEHLGIGLERVQIAVNGYWQRKQLTVGQAEQALGMKVSHFVPYDPAAVNQAINQGVPVVLHRPSAKISHNLRNLSASLNGHFTSE